MIHFLRTANNKTVIEATAGKDDLSVAVDLVQFAEILLEINQNRLNELVAFVKDFSALQELRGEYFEHPSMTKAHGTHPETPNQFVERRFREVGACWDLRYVTD